MRRRWMLVGIGACFAPLAALGQASPPPFAPPPPIYTPTAEERAQLDEKERELSARLKTLAGGQRQHLPDAAVYLHIAEMADRLQLYATRSHVGTVLRGLDEGLARCDQLGRGEAPWLTRPGRSLRGYVSRVDGSIQPYGVVLPSGFEDSHGTPGRLDVVLHGRGPTEVTFLNGFIPAASAKAPDQPFIEVHPFGRANNGWRWSGETDVFEALDAAKKQYRLDPNRTVLRGFSMGGHGAWHIGVHYPGLWAAVSPGAGFTDTRNYIKIQSAPPYQEAGWHIYDAVDYALNLFDTPFVAYGGEDDPQLQASLNMKAAVEHEGLPFNLIIGPHTKHAYEPNSLREIMRQLATHVRDPEPKQVRFTTWTLKYNRCKWVTIDGLQEHYQRAQVEADASGPVVRVKTDHVTALTLDPIPGNPRRLEIDGTRLSLSEGKAHLIRTGSRWRTGSLDARLLRKRHNLQGPIDDAFMERFAVVRGTGAPWSPAAAAYAAGALRRFTEDWRFGFRGELPVRDDTEAGETAAEGNLVLFGDPGSNRILARIVDRLPLRWTHDGLDIAGRHYGSDHVPVLIYPNPLNPRHYVVINSGHTFTRADLDASNANLFPKLPDWAVLQVGHGAPRVVAADFFDERWQIRGGHSGR